MKWQLAHLAVLLVLCSSTLALAKKKRGETLWVPHGHGDKAHGEKIRDKQRQAQRLKWAHKRAHKKNWTGPGKRNHSWAMGALPQARAVHLGGHRAQQAPNHELLRVGAEAVRLASLLCANAQQQLSSSEKVDKNDDSPVTVADYAAQAVVAWSLSRSPAACQGGRLSMVAEEDSVTLREPASKAMLARITDLINGVITTADPTAHVTPDDVINLIDLGTSAGGPTGRHWVLDPIDGTRGFVGMRQYSVCLGMLQDGEVELGLLGCPNLPKGLVSDDAGDDQSMARSLTGIDTIGALFLALRGYGSYVTDLTGAPDLSDLQPIHVHDLTDVSLARFMESYESRHSDHSFSAALAREMGVTAPPLRMDSQVKYGLLSRGAASIFMRFPPASYKEKIWDHCAGVVIVEEAGGRVTDAGGRRLDFSKGRYLELDRGIVAAPPNVHQEILRAISAVEAGGKSPR